jgi:hypothetical protein
VYGTTKQYADTIDTSPPLSKEDKKYVQEVVGMFLYYAGCVDSTMLTALGSIAGVLGIYTGVLSRYLQ